MHDRMTPTGAAVKACRVRDAGRMPGRGTPQVTLRIDPALWEWLRQAAQARGMSRSELLRGLLRWWLRVPGAELPERPPGPTG